MHEVDWPGVLIEKCADGVIEQPNNQFRTTDVRQLILGERTRGEAIYPRFREPREGVKAVDFTPAFGDNDSKCGARGDPKFEGHPAVGCLREGIAQRCICADALLCFQEVLSCKFITLPRRKLIAGVHYVSVAASLERGYAIKQPIGLTGNFGVQSVNLTAEFEQLMICCLIETSR